LRALNEGYIRSVGTSDVAWFARLNSGSDPDFGQVIQFSRRPKPSISTST